MSIHIMPFSGSEGYDVRLDIEEMARNFHRHLVERINKLREERKESDAKET